MTDSNEVIQTLKRLFDYYDREFENEEPHMRNFALGRLSGINAAINAVVQINNKRPKRKWWQR